MRLHVTLVLFKLARFASVFFSSLLIRPATGTCSLRATCRSDWMMFIRHSTRAAALSMPKLVQLRRSSTCLKTSSVVWE